MVITFGYLSLTINQIIMDKIVECRWHGLDSKKAAFYFNWMAIGSALFSYYFPNNESDIKDKIQTAYTRVSKGVILLLNIFRQLPIFLIIDQI